MDSRSAYRLQVMEKLGAPLLRALPADLDGEKAAETVASLVGKAIQAGLSFSQSMKLSDEDGDIDSIRLSLAAIAAPLLADHYKNTGKLPDDAALEKITKGLEAALVFSESFTAAIEHTARLKSLHEPLPVFDATQVNLLTLNALVPAVCAVQQFPFGQGAPALVKEIAARLEKTAGELCGASVQGGDEDRVFGKLMVLRALAELYAGAHERIASQHKGDAPPDIAVVWKEFDEQAAMMMALAGAAVPTEASGSAAPAPAKTKPVTSAPASENPAPAASADKSASPMGFFKKPGSEGPAPADNEPAAEQPSETPAPPPEKPPEAPAASPASTPPAGNGNPMSFFKPGAKKPEGEE